MRCFLFPLHRNLHFATRFTNGTKFCVLIFLLSLFLSVFCAENCVCEFSFKRVESFFKHYHALVPLTQWNTQTITKVTTNYRVYILRIVCEWVLNCVYGCNTQPGFFFRFIRFFFSPKTFTCANNFPLFARHGEFLLFSVCVCFLVLLFSSVFSLLRSH